MPLLLIYIIKFSISLAAVFLFYQLVLRRLTFYNWNRAYLLGYSLLSFVVPLIDISATLQDNGLNDSSMINWLPLLQLKQTTEVKDSLFTPWNIISFLFIAGIVFMSIRLIVQLISYRRMVKKAKLISADGFNIYQVDEDIIPFSFGNAVFINSRLHTEAELQEIIRHEIVHVKQKHSADIIFSEMLCMVNWFNPFAWLIRKAIRQNLEFIADNQVLDHGMDKKQYQYLLLKVIGNNHFSIAPKFNFSSLKKRIAMMNKLKSAKINLLRFLFVLPLLAVVLVSFRNEISDRFNNNFDAETTLSEFVSDTVPIVNTLSNKGYYIEVWETKKKADPLIIVKDKSKKETERITLSEWSKRRDYYENLYGTLPPPPPPSAPGKPALPPPPTAPANLPENVQRISVNNDLATVWLKNGSKENFDLNVTSQKEQFEKKYGKMPPPPPPVPPIEPIPPIAPIAPIGMNEGIRKVANKVEITDKEAILHLKNGTIERYDLTNKESKQKFEDKYGDIIPLSPSAPNPKGESLIEILNNDLEMVDASEWASKSSPGQNLLIRADNKNPMIILDGKVITEAEMHELNPNSIESINVLKGKNATDIYKEKGKDGVMIITSKK